MKKTDLKNLEEAYSQIKTNPKCTNESVEIGGISFGDSFIYEVIPTWTTVLVTSLIMVFGAEYSDKIKSVVSSFAEKYATSRLKNDPEIVSMMKQYKETQDQNERREIFLNVNDRLSNLFFNIFKLSPTQKSNVWKKMKEKL